MQLSLGLLFTLGLSLCIGVDAVPRVRKGTISPQNGNDAILLNAKSKALRPPSPCETNEVACVDNQLAKCVDGQFVLTPCSAGLMCRASPKIGSSGATIGCVAESENEIRIIARQTNGTDDPSQSSLSLDPAVISTGFQQNGQDNITVSGQSPSGVSSNNWINFCKTVNMPLTNGTQIPGGSCNPVPIGVIPSKNNMPSAKFIFPPNFAALAKGQTFTIQIAVNHLETGWFTNPDETFLSAPVEVNSSGDVMGHSHVVVQQLTGFGQTTPTDPTKFAFFKALNNPAVNGVLTGDVTGGLPAGYYRIAVFHSGMNHQPIALPIAQRGAMGDMVYFSVI